MKAGLGILVACLAVAGGACGQLFETRYRDVAAEMAQSAGDLAFWCQGNGLAGDRVRLNRRYTDWLMAYTPARNPRR
ncbi:MAG: hypothetical protein HRU14_14055 [Planctomycetes bacterium]|jgi:hypothetical protein|nr:hypothetical protein [Planctomycetota bacterium]